MLAKQIILNSTQYCVKSDICMLQNLYCTLKSRWMIEKQNKASQQCIQFVVLPPQIDTMIYTVCGRTDTPAWTKFLVVGKCRTAARHKMFRNHKHRRSQHFGNVFDTFNLLTLFAFKPFYIRCCIEAQSVRHDLRIVFRIQWVTRAITRMNRMLHNGYTDVKQTNVYTTYKSRIQLPWKCYAHGVRCVFFVVGPNVNTSHGVWN